jgi:hypothetical protein
MPSKKTSAQLDAEIAAALRGHDSSYPGGYDPAKHDLNSGVKIQSSPGSPYYGTANIQHFGTGTKAAGPDGKFHPSFKRGEPLVGAIQFIIETVNGRWPTAKDRRVLDRLWAERAKFASLLQEKGLGVGRHIRLAVVDEGQGRYAVSDYNGGHPIGTVQT